MHIMIGAVQAGRERCSMLLKSPMKLDGFVSSHDHYEVLLCHETKLIENLFLISSYHLLTFKPCQINFKHFYGYGDNKCGEGHRRLFFIPHRKWNWDPSCGHLEWDPSEILGLVYPTRIQYKAKAIAVRSAQLWTFGNPRGIGFPLGWEYCQSHGCLELLGSYPICPGYESFSVDILNP
jgi:hypothetical protein